MRSGSSIVAIALLFSTASFARAASTTIDFSDRAPGATPSPLIYPTVTFGSASGLRIFSFANLGVGRALCPHATNACRSAVTLDFSGPVNNVSFDVIQVDELGKFLTVTGFGSGGAIAQSVALTRGFNTNRIDLSAIVGITRLTLDGTSDEEGVLYGNFRFEVGAIPGAVPEPATWMTMLVGFGVLGAIRRRRAKRLLIA